MTTHIKKLILLLNIFSPSYSTVIRKLHFPLNKLLSFFSVTTLHRQCVY